MEKGAEMIIMKNFFISFMFLFGGLFSQKFGGANDPNAFKGINLNNPYGVDIPLSTKISYKNNDNATFDDIFNKNGIPKLLIMGYYDCDMMCDAQVNMFGSLLLSWTLSLTILLGYGLLHSLDTPVHCFRNHVRT